MSLGLVAWFGVSPPLFVVFSCFSFFFFFTIPLSFLSFPDSEKKSKTPLTLPFNLTPYHISRLSCYDLLFLQE